MEEPGGKTLRGQIPNSIIVSSNSTVPISSAAQHGQQIVLKPSQLGAGNVILSGLNDYEY